MIARVPAATVRWFPEGTHCTDPLAGDILCVDHGTTMAAAIKFGERLMAVWDRELRPFCWTGHTALMADVERVSEMGFKGHEFRPLDHYADRLYAVVSPQVSEEARAAVLANDRECWGLDYGWVEYPALVVDALSGARFAASWGDTMDCSTHVTMCWMGGGLWPDRQPGGVAPAHVARYFGAVPPVGLRSSPRG